MTESKVREYILPELIKGSDLVLVFEELSVDFLREWRGKIRFDIATSLYDAIEWENLSEEEIKKVKEFKDYFYHFSTS